MKKWSLYALLPLLWFGCAKPDSFDFLGIQSINVKSISFTEAQLELVGSFYNPNNYPVQFKDATVDVTINNQFLGTTTLDSLITVPKKDTFHLPVLLNAKLSMNLLGLATQLFQGDQDFEIELKGKSKIGRGGVFINYPINYKGKPMID